MARRGSNDERLATSGDATTCDDLLSPCETYEGSRHYAIDLDDDEDAPPSLNDTVVMSAGHLAKLRAELLAQAERDAYPTQPSMPAIPPEIAQAARARRARGLQ
jgi:hypothetical protein